MNKHTPGPWTIRAADSGFREPEAADFAIVGANKICPGIVWAGLAGESEANARLIAAAPDLLKAAKAQRHALNRCIRYFLGKGAQPEPEELAEVVAAQDRAIAKAEGRS